MLTTDTDDADQAELLVAALFSECEILRWTPIFRGALLGKTDVCLGGILEMFDSPVLAGADGQPWVGTPGRPMVGRDGKPVIGPNGKAAYESCVSWRGGRWVKARWSAVVIAALQHRFGDDVLLGDRS